MARESGARFGRELYVDSLSKPDGPVPTYLELLRRDARDDRRRPQGRGPGMSAPIVQATDVAVSYGDNVALDGVDLTLDGGLVHGLIGMNGSGKSTLFKTLMGLHARRPRPDRAVRRLARQGPGRRPGGLRAPERGRGLGLPGVGARRGHDGPLRAHGVHPPRQ